MGENRVEKNYLKIKLNTLIGLLLIFFMGLGIVSFFMLNKEKEFSGQANKLRIETSVQRCLIKEMAKEKTYIMKENFYPYAIVDLKGRVEKSFITKLKAGEQLDLEKEIGYDNAIDVEEKIRYTVPLVLENQIGSVIIELPKNILASKNPYIALWVLILIIIVVIIFNIKSFINRDVVLPIKELHKSSKSILKGNYGEKVVYDYHGEIGEFCHDFERMRDELKVAKEKEERLKKNEKELLACISHDLKTPLSSIMGYVEGIRDGIVKDREGIIKYSNTIIRRSKELSKLIDDILEQSKAELNEMQISKKEVYLDEYLEEVLNDFSIDIKNNGMELRVIGEIPKAIVEIDEIRITQVISNIISNSIKYAKTGKYIDVWVKDGLKEVEINIKDYGNGIESIDIPFVFNKFYRGEKSRNTTISGSGLGLSIAKHIIEKHGGEIRCISKEGTIIKFTLKK